MPSLFCEVVFPIPAAPSYSYRVPHDLTAGVVSGARVRAPLGRDRGRCGVVLSVSSEPPPVPPDTLREIAGVLESPAFFDAEHLHLAQVIAERYLLNPGEVLEQMFQLDEVPRRTGHASSPAISRPAPAWEPPLPHIEALFRPTGGVSPARLCVPSSWDQHADLLGGILREAARLGRQALVVFAQVQWLRDTLAVIGRRQPGLADGIAEYSGEMSIMHRYQVWRACRSGEVRAVFATRSGAYLPLSDSAVIVVDEPDEPGHRSLSSPQVSTWEIALLRAASRGVPCIALSSAPSLELRSSCGASPRLIPAPAIPVRRNRPGERLSSVLVREAYKFRQVLVLYPYKGFARSVVCASCRTPMRCPSCGMPVGYRMDSREYRCGACGHVRKKFRCASCGGTASIGFGAGIQKMLAMLERHLPQVSVARLDADVPEKERWRIVTAFNRRALDVIMATRELFTYARALDWSNVSLVYVARADALTHRPSFRAVEQVRRWVAQCREFLQCAPSPAVVLEFFVDDSHAAALMEDDAAFVQRETTVRHELGYPPAVRLLQVSFAASMEGALPSLDGLSDVLQRETGVQAFVCREPAPRSGQARQTLLIKAPVDSAFDWRPVLQRLRPLRTESVRMTLAYDPDDF
jgi:primosomal protein N'